MPKETTHFYILCFLLIFKIIKYELLVRNYLEDNDLSFAKTILLLNLPENMFYERSRMWDVIENHKFQISSINNMLCHWERVT